MKSKIGLAKIILENAGYNVEKVTEYSSSDKKFKVGDVVEWSGLYGGHYTGKVKKVDEDEILLDISWISEDDGSEVHDDSTYELEKDSQGNECIIVWEYHGEKGYVYPPSDVNESVGEEYKDSVEEFFSHLHKAFEILKNTEEGVLESIVKDDELYDRLQDYIYNLDTAILSNYKKN